MTCNVADTRFTCEGIGPPFWCAMRSRSVVITGCRSPSPGFEMNQVSEPLKELTPSSPLTRVGITIQGGMNMRRGRGATGIPGD